ncbi:hypothetical protein Tco_0847910 [Tanacetum coccineum]
MGRSGIRIRGVILVTPGSVIVPPGSVVVPPGSVVVPTGSVVVPPGSVVTTGSILVSPGSVITTADGDRRVCCLNRNLYCTGFGLRKQDDMVWSGSSVVIVNPGSVVVPPGSVVVPPGSVVTTGSILVSPGSVITTGMLKKFGLEDSKPMKTSMSTDTKLTKDEEGEYADNTKNRGMRGSLLYLMKQTALAISTTKAGYVRAEKACQQALWMKQALFDYDIRLDDIPIMKILCILFQGQRVFTIKWPLDALSAYQETSSPYHNELPNPNEINWYLQFERTESNRVIKGELVQLSSNHILTKEALGINHSRECFLA